MKKQQRTTTASKIDIASIYNQMRKELSERAQLQKEQDSLWSIIKRYNCNRSAQMSQITKKIGNSTHRLNQLINELCKYKKTHKAMNMAHDYIIREIERINKIINSKNKLIRDVNAGYSCLITSTGVTHTNTSDLENYIRLKREQVKKLENWKRSVERYMV